jgi:SecD/SecF fusion protein
VSDRRNHLILVAGIVAALVGVALLAIPGSPIHRKVTLGLDLQGGLEVVLKAQPPKGHVLTSSDLQRSKSIMLSRVDKLGVSEPSIVTQGKDQIVIQLAGVHDPVRAAQIIGKTAQLEMYDLEADVTGPSAGVNGAVNPYTSVYKLLHAASATAARGTPAGYYLFNREKQSVAQADTRDQLLANYRGKVPKGFTVLAVPANTIVLTCGTDAVVCPGVQTSPPTGTTYYLFRHDTAKGVPEVTGNDLNLSGTKQDFDPNTGQPVVLIGFNHKGSHKFQQVTRNLYVRGQLRNTPQHFAIVLDNDIKSFPQIDYTDSSLANGISGNAQITGLSSLKEAKDLALVLQTGALPVNFVQIERTDVSATLGKDSLNQAKKAALIGLVLVAIFLLVVYRFLGLVAVIGLGIYAALLYAAILLFNVTLTLPGFAGMILTIGVAADANVVIFERIKEEVRSGKSVRAAIAAGYAKGFHTIVDANVVTAITALVLFAVATAQVKGFALMLLIGTAISLLTAVAATRAMLGLLADFRWFDNPSFMGAKGQQGAKWLQIDFMGKRRIWLTIAAAAVALSLLSLGVKGLNLGIDFKGGTQVTFNTQQAQSLDLVRRQARDIGQADAVIQGRGSQSGSGNYKSFQIRTKSLTPSQQATLTRDLQQRVGAVALGMKNVSSSFSHQIARLAVIAIIVSLSLIVLYIAIRFDYKFAIPVIVALLHDIALTLGVYSITGREVTTSTVAAVLTVLGYSIYDTIIIFDRIRENIPLMRRASFATIANVSLWETIRRSLATTFITLLPVLSLLFYGGSTLKDFAFALLVGITSGAYSSIFIAAPLLTMWKEREPEYKRRIGSKDLSGAASVGRTEVVEAPAAQPEVEAEPEPVAAGSAERPADAKRERRRQRRRTRPHGRAR